MKINKVKLISGGILINDNICLSDSNTGHIRTSFNDWLAQGNTPEPMNIIDPWSEIRRIRDRKIAAVQFEYERNSRELRLNIVPSRSIEWIALLDDYVQALADIPQKFKDTPGEIIWPHFTE